MNFSKVRAARQKSIYLFPNLVTTGALFSGFYGIVAAMQGNYENAAIAILVAMVFDGLDGRVARFMNAQSAFGSQYDSLSDSICFGIAPALVVYSWGLSTLGKFGWIAAFILTAATCLRLARFNVQSETIGSNRFFAGLPCPPAAGWIATIVWLSVQLGISPTNPAVSYFAAFVTILISVLMTSNVPYYSFKDLAIRGKVPFLGMLVIVLIVALVAWDPPKVLFCAGVMYISSGPLYWLISYRNKVSKVKRNGVKARKR